MGLNRSIHPAKYNSYWQNFFASERLMPEKAS